MFNNFAFFLIFLFGLSNALEYGAKYGIALNFVALITDMQWDALASISTVANVDICHNKFNYKEHRTNAYKLLAILIVTVILMCICLFGFYELDLKITMIYLLIEFGDFILYPIYRIKTCYLQLEWSAFKTTSNKITASILRMCMSFLKTPFCTGIGQVTSAIYQFITINAIFRRYYKIEIDGKIEQIDR